MTKKMQDRLFTDLKLLTERLRFLQTTLEELEIRIADLEEQWESGEMPIKADWDEWDS